MKFCWHTDQIRCDNCKPKSERIELGCASRGQCFCTGRCKRTLEEQEYHEKIMREFQCYRNGNNQRIEDNSSSATQSEEEQKHIPVYYGDPEWRKKHTCACSDRGPCAYHQEQPPVIQHEEDEPCE